MSRKLFVGNLPYSVTSERLQEAFSQFGTVSSSKVIVDRETGRSRGFAFLEMETDDQGAAAMQAMNGALLDGRSIAVREAVERQHGGGGGGGFGGGGGGGGGAFGTGLSVTSWIAVDWVSTGTSIATSGGGISTGGRSIWGGGGGGGSSFFCTSSTTSVWIGGATSSIARRASPVARAHAMNTWIAMITKKTMVLRVKKFVSCT